MGFVVVLWHSNMLMVSLPHMQAFTVHPKAFLQGESVTDDRHYIQALRLPIHDYSCSCHMLCGGLRNGLICYASTISVISTLQLRSNYNNRLPACYSWLKLCNGKKYMQWCVHYIASKSCGQIREVFNCAEGYPNQTRGPNTSTLVLH